MASVQDVLGHARSELGTVEGAGNKTEYAAEAGHANGYAWCATFQVAMFRRAGIKLGNESAYTPSLYNSLKSQGRAISGPKVGAVVFFHYPSMGRIAHVGLVESVLPDGRFITIEGNTDVAGGRTGGQVMRKTRSAVNTFFTMPLYAAAEPSSQPANTPAPTPAPAPKPAPVEVFKRGNKGPAVTHIQHRLNFHGYGPVHTDGDFGPATEATVVRFQRHNGLESDGVVGPRTLHVLNSPPKTISVGATGAAVHVLQHALNHHIRANLRVDGSFGPSTLRAVKYFQQTRGLTVDGVVGPKTWEKLQ